MHTSPCQRLLLVGSGIALVGALADPSLRLIFLCLLLLFVPGYLVERLLPATRPPLLVRSAVWLALSLSLNALLYQWLWATGLSLSTSALWLGCGLMSAGALVAAWRDLAVPWSPHRDTWDTLLTPITPEHAALSRTRKPIGTPCSAFGNRQSTIVNGITIVIVLITIGARLHDISSLTFPPWVDSVHHALLIRIAAETGSAPTSLQPYLPVEDLPYHWGYHVFIANLLRISGLDILETMLISGQLLNALQALTVAALAYHMWRRPLAAPLAALIVGCISLMPAYYLSWGRYTQLTGLLMLPGLAIAWSWGLEKASKARAFQSRGIIPEQGEIQSDAPQRHREHRDFLLARKSLGLAGDLAVASTSSATAPLAEPVDATAPLAEPVEATRRGPGLFRANDFLEGQADNREQAHTNILGVLCASVVKHSLSLQYSTSRTTQERASPFASPWLLGGLILAGLSLVHFRILLFALALLAALTLVWMVGQAWRNLSRPLLYMLATAGSAIMLTLPWLWLLLQRTLVPAVSSEGGLAGGGSYNAFNSGLLWVGANYLLVALALLGAWLGLWRRSVATGSILLWVGFMLIMANPWLLTYLMPALGLLLLSTRRVSLIMIGGGMLLFNPQLVQLPYLWLIPNDVVVISLFVPMAILISGGVVMLYERHSAKLGRLGPIVLLISIIGSGAWGLHAMQASIINRATVFGSPAERAAITWAKQHTPTDARFLVNAAPWLPTARRGADAGWWLMPLAERWVSAPPVVFTYGDAAYVQHINAINDTMITYTPGQEQAIFELIASEGITHIYLVDGRGPLERSMFEGRTGFRVVYDLGGVVVVGVEEV
ncbi:hypothetical protein [Candidatus Viridilinea mediisalina]|uniref:Glycosyltransferase RgtA/B/C/D-like domain-containing protein n=1 Tax=Candidatus Viridilinea mediisalina TaxID=2024553 RepID=A0A2A6RLG8_9CHLR|nr:hypothetical protein [Candidatus Viridilinea mediisalina]PDW03902.1 hypothetical protein CJ255_06525 [Candidatus Viridilinea mediisalina]